MRPAHKGRRVLDAYHEERRNRILAGIDTAGRRGLEIGPLDRALVRKSDGPVEYVDYTDTESLRARLYAGVDPAEVPEMDHVWASQPLHELVGEPVGYIAASHVIEHVPDLLGWLTDLRGALADDGVLTLAIPDRRFTFDILRPESTLGDVIEAFLLKARQPSLRHVFDNCNLGVAVDHAEAWREPPAGRTLPQLAGQNALQLAYDQCVEIAERPRYIDSHCWVFTPASFLLLYEGLARLKLAPFSIRSFTPTRRDDIEFLVQMTPADPKAPDAILESVALARLTLESADAPSAPAAPQAAPRGSQPRSLLGWLTGRS